MFGQYAGFIIPSYVITAVVLIALTVWIVLAQRRYAREIAALEERGIRRGARASGGAGAGSANPTAGGAGR